MAGKHRRNRRAGRRTSSTAPASSASAGSLGSRVGAPDGPPRVGGMPSALPEGDPAPADGSLPASALEGLGARPFGFYVHVPFCTVRCGYCDFNTYTSTDLGRDADVPGASRTSYADAAIAEVRFARRVLGDVDLPVDTVFFGGGTPTLLPPEDLVRVVGGDPRRVRPGRRRRGHHRVQPRQRRRRRPGPAARGRDQPGVVRHAVVGLRTCCGCWTGPTTRAGCRRWCAGPARPASSRSAWT